MNTVKDIPWECGKGWWPLIEKVATAIDAYNAAHPDTPVKVSQIKEKFGGLRIYYNYGAPEYIKQIVHEAIQAAWHTCERCGATEGVATSVTGYKLTLCPDCHKEIKPREATATMENRIKLQQVLAKRRERLLHRKNGEEDNAQ